jgi:eukaryotic-like serine/threonine-protein kinase
VTPERWQRVKVLFAAAQELDLGERETFVVNASDGDLSVSREVLDLLAAATAVEARDFIEEPPLGLLAAGGGALAHGYRLGSYRIDRELGRGGMGAVYLALRADDEYDKKVAIKVLRWGISSEDLVQRFRQERQILASLEHPNIAALLDGGTASGGLSYFVMEFVDGVPIDEYCSAHHLPQRTRLELVRIVCAAVHVAHRSLIVHRDLKPANILVTEGGVPKLLDFGIAKLLQVPDTATQMLMTPAYASPEQLSGGPITTSTDVYGLGLLLHLLLIGRLPLRPWQVEGAGGQGDTTTPADAASPRRDAGGKELPRLRGDLARIVAMALQHDPAKRYPSAQALANDIGRYLSGQPVAARDDSWSYRTAKFVQRHRAAVAAAALMLALIIGSGITTALSLRKSILQQRRAEAISSFLEQLFAIPDPNRSRGETVTAREVLDRGSRDIQNKLQEQPEIRAALMETMVKVYENLGLYRPALDLAQKTVALRRKTLGHDDPDLADSLHSLASALREMGHNEAAEPYLREALAIQRDHAHGDDPELARGMNNFASLLQDNGHFDEAEHVYRDALDMKRRLNKGDNEDVAMGLHNLAEFLAWDRKNYAAAEPLYWESIAMRQRLVGPAPDPRVAKTLNGLGNLYQDKKDLIGAERFYRQALAMRLALNKNSPEVARTLNNLASLRLQRGDARDAQTLFQQALDVYDQGHLDQHSLDHAVILRNLADLLCRREPAQGEPLARQALSAWQHAKPGNWRIADAESVLGGCLAGLHREAEAEPLVSAGYKHLAAQRGADDMYTQQALTRAQAFYATRPADERARATRSLMQAAAAAPAASPSSR